MGKLAANPNWKGGRTITADGYVLLKRPDHPDADVRGYVYEHRLVAEQTLGRRLTSREQVHHRNGKKADNRPDNLVVTASRWAHAEQHRIKHTERRRHDESNPTVACVCGCGATFPKYDSGHRPRRYVTGHNVRHGADGRWEALGG